MTAASCRYSPTDGHAGNPQDGHANEQNRDHHAPVGPLEVVRVAGQRVPARIAASLGGQLDKGRHQDRQHGNWGDVLPAQHPVEMGSRTGHQLDVVGEPGRGEF